MPFNSKRDCRQQDLSLLSSPFYRACAIPKSIRPLESSERFATGQRRPAKCQPHFDHSRRSNDRCACSVPASQSGRAPSIRCTSGNANKRQTYLEAMARAAALAENGGLPAHSLSPGPTPAVLKPPPIGNRDHNHLRRRVAFMTTLPLASTGSRMHQSSRQNKFNEPSDRRSDMTFRTGKF